VQFVSTRNNKDKVSFSRAIVQPVPKDGGMYAPAYEENLRPWILHMDDSTPFNSIAGSLTSALLKDEFSPIISETIAAKAFPFSPVLSQIDKNLFVLELYHGPTGSHKDFGVSYLASCLEHILIMQDKKATVLAVTNGETGACLAHAFRNKTRLQAILLYTKGSMRGFKDSDCIWNGGNLYPVEVNGTEEDCFRAAREIYADQDLIQRYNLTLANSLNIGRLLPQTFFYTYAFTRLKKLVHSDIYYALAAGNYGNLVAGLYSWKFSLPVNGFITDSSASLFADAQGKCTILDSVIPLNKRGPSDPVNPSNIERLEEVFFANPAVIRGLVYPSMVNPKEMEKAFQDFYITYKRIIDPSTASAWAAAKKKSDVIEADEGAVVLLARNHPSLEAKTIKQWCGETIVMPDSIKEMYVPASSKKTIDPERNAVVNILHELS
jgi:threonine synthase